jgi:hypothetical protein
MKLYQLVTLFVGVTLAACNSGGGRKVVGKQCPGGDYKPISMNVAPTQKKLALNPQQNEIPPGVYSYEGSTLYYIDKSDLRVVLNDARQKDNNFKTGMVCVRNAKNVLHPMAVESIHSMSVSKDLKYLVEVTKLSIGTSNSKITVSAVKDTVKKLESPDEPYQGAQAFMVSTEKNTTNYEIRSEGVTADGGKYTMVVFLKRTDNK